MKLLKLWLFTLKNESLIFARSRYWLVPATWGLVIFLLSPRFGTTYSPDSYAYYLIGTNFISGFGYVSQAIRDFYLQFSPDFFQPSRSFPPLMPILVGITDKLFPLGISSGLLVNIVVLLAMLHVHFFFSKKFSGKFFWIIFLALPVLFFRNNGFIAEILAGRSIPLVGFLYTFIILIISSHTITVRKSFLLGALLGLLFLTRFDSLIFCFLFVGFLYFFKIAHLRWVIFGWLIVLSPWLVRNIIVFGNPLASDNSITVFSTHPAMVQISWFENIPMWGDNPGLWVTQRLSYVYENSKIIFRLFFRIGGPLTIALAALGLYIPNTPKIIKIYTAVAWLWLISNVVAVSLTPYHDERYFSLSVFAVGLSALLIALNWLFNKKRKKLNRNGDSITGATSSQTNHWIYLVMVLSVAIGLGGYFVKPKIVAGDINSNTHQCVYNEFKNEITRDHLVAYTMAEQLAYYSQWKTIYLPLNLTEPDEHFLSWKLKFNVSYAILPEGSNLAKHPQFTMKKKACGFVLVDFTKS